VGQILTTFINVPNIVQNLPADLPIRIQSLDYSPGTEVFYDTPQFEGIPGITLEPKRVYVPGGATIDTTLSIRTTFDTPLGNSELVVWQYAFGAAGQRISTVLTILPPKVSVSLGQCAFDNRSFQLGKLFGKALHKWEFDISDLRSEIPAWRCELSGWECAFDSRRFHDGDHLL
jgi:hypothetical protein